MPLCKKSSWKLIIYFFIPLLSAISFTAEGQVTPDYHKIDSVLYQLKKSKPDSNRVRLLNELSADWLQKKELSTAEFEDVFKHLQHAVSLCDSLGLSFAQWKTQSLHLMGDALVLFNKIPEGRDVFMELVKNAHNAGDRKREAECWTGYAEALWKANKLAPFEHEAETAYTNAINIYCEIKDRKEDIDISLRLAALYGRNAEYSKA